MKPNARPAPTPLHLAWALSLALGGTAAQAQEAPAGSPPAPGAASTSSSAAGPLAGNAAVSGPSPWYVGVEQGITHSSNVYQVPSGSGDTWSSTSLLAGFDQPFGRQRVRGAATVTANRYFDETTLDNTAYDLSAGLDWATIYRLSGSLDLGLDRGMAQPSASAASPVARKNMARTETFDARVRWGGDALFTLEAGYDHSRLDYSAPEYITAETRRDSGSLAAYYRPGGPVRLGIGVRADRARMPNAVLDPIDGDYDANTTRGRYLDLYADYALPSRVTFTSRLSYARQRNSSLDGADFTGLTGRLGMNWQATGRLTVNAYAARDAGSDLAVSNGTGATASPGGGGVFVPTVNRFENNRVTYSTELGAVYRVGARTSVNGGARYSRARLVATGVAAGGEDLPRSTDVSKAVFLGAAYDIRRNWSAACNLSHESRDVSGGADYGYRVTTIGCSTRLLLR